LKKIKKYIKIPYLVFYQVQNEEDMMSKIPKEDLLFLFFLLIMAVSTIFAGGHP